MVKRRIEWSIEARNDLIQLIEFYNEKNASNKYSLKLNQKIQNSLLTIAKNPNVGIKTSYPTISVLTTGDFQIIHEIFALFILVIVIWDCRRNPADKRIGRRIKS